MKPVTLDAFADELHKIARAAPKKEKKVEAKPPPLAARIVGGSVGAGMIAGQAPLIKGYTTGRSNLYHATNLGAAHGIMISPKGIDPSFAGVGKRVGAMEAGVRGFLGAEADQLLQPENVRKAARINRSLMAESLNRLLEEKGLPLEYEHLVSNADEFHKLMDRGVKASDAATHVANRVTQELISQNKLTPQAAQEITNGLKETLPRFGERVYMGAHPADVKAWASGKPELQMLAEKQRAFAQRMSTTGGKAGAYAEMGADVLFGGLPTTAKDIAHRLKYRPATTESMTRAQAAEELARLHQSGAKSGVVFGASVPTAQMGYMEDFPVVKHVVNLNPGIKSTLRNYIETYDPGRDLSFPHAVPSKNIKTVDIVDQATGAIRRLNISDFEHAARSPFLKRMSRMAAPAAFAGLGGMAVYRAFKPKKKMVPKSSPLAPTPPPKKARKTKTSSVASDVGNIAKYVVPVVGGAGAVGAGAHYLAEKALPENRVDPKLKGVAKAKAEGVEIGRSMGRVFGSSLAAAGVGALGGVVAAKPVAAKLLGKQVAAALPAGKMRRLGALFGGGGTAYLATPAIAGREAAQHPETDPYWQATPEKVQDFVRKHPSLGAARDSAIFAGIPIAGAFTLRKYYPSTFARGALAARKGLAEMAGFALKNGALLK